MIGTSYIYITEIYDKFIVGRVFTTQFTICIHTKNLNLSHSVCIPLQFHHLNFKNMEMDQIQNLVNNIFVRTFPIIS